MIPDRISLLPCRLSLRTFTTSTQNAVTHVLLLVWLIVSMIIKILLLHSHRLHALKNGKKHTPVPLTSLRKYRIIKEISRKGCVSILQEPLCILATDTDLSSVWRQRGKVWNRTESRWLGIMLKDIWKMLPARFCQILFRNEKIGGEGERYTGYRHNFILCLHCLIENELFQPADKPRHRSSSLIITFLAALSVLSVLCICCLRVLPWNKPQWVIYLPNRRNPSAFHFLFFSSYSQICIIPILFKNLDNNLIVPLIKEKSPCPPFDNLFRWQNAECALKVHYFDCGVKVDLAAIALGTLVPRGEPLRLQSKPSSGRGGPKLRCVNFSDYVYSWQHWIYLVCRK